MSWQDINIDESVNQAVPVLLKRGLATRRRTLLGGRDGYSTSELDETQRRLGHPLPEDVYKFYRRVRPVPESPGAEYGLVGFQPADDPDLRWLNNEEERNEVLWTLEGRDVPLKGWNRARLLVIGYTPFGDTLLYCEGLTDRENGTIVLTDHESDEALIVLGDRLAAWLARYAAFDAIEASIAPASLDTLSPKRAVPFLEDHLRLNPGATWAKEKLNAFRNGTLPAPRPAE